MKYLREFIKENIKKYHILERIEDLYGETNNQ